MTVQDANAMTPQSVDDLAATIASIWGGVLGAQDCSRSANFFDLGGSSLKMMRVHAELSSALGRDVSIVELFAHPTIESLAERLFALRAVASSPVQAFPAAQKPLARFFRPLKTAK